MCKFSSRYMAVSDIERLDIPKWHIKLGQKSASPLLRNSLTPIQKFHYAQINSKLEFF